MQRQHRHMSKNSNSQPVDRYPFLMALDLADELVILTDRNQLKEEMACFQSQIKNTSFNGVAGTWDIWSYWIYQKETERVNWC